MSTTDFIQAVVDSSIYWQSEDDQEISFARFENDDSINLMVCHNILPGIDLVYNRFKSREVMKRQYSCDGKSVIEINYCAEGRFYCLLDGKAANLGEGEIDVHFGELNKSEAEFTLGWYKGITLIIDTEELGNRIQEIFPEINIQLNILMTEMRRHNGAVKIRAIPELLKLFDSLYKKQPSMQKFYLRLKIFEILVLIQTMPVSDCIPKQYFRKRDFEIVKEIYNEAIANLDKRYSLQELANRYSIGRTTLQRCFKEIYGQSYYSFLKRYRMQEAIHLLQQGNKSITEIAGMLGYANASKFTSAFRSIYNHNPNEYKKSGV